GGDTDSVAAIVGALVGARIGPDRFPAHLLDGLVEWPRTLQWLTLLGERLARTRTPQALATPLALNLPGLLLRNVFFFALVLMHGLRRLLPPY
ncbi:MAG: ADP-ribosylglycohydrolase family protein, partial [Candidatus Accumulibacter phosphatis]